MKKKASLAALVLALCLVMTACGSGAAPGAAPAVPAESAAPEAKILRV